MVMVKVNRGVNAEERRVQFWHVEFKVPSGQLSGDLASPWVCEAGTQKEVCARVKLYFI